LQGVARLLRLHWVARPFFLSFLPRQKSLPSAMLKQIASSLFQVLPSGTLPQDTYAAIDAAKEWLQSDQLSDGFAVHSILQHVARHTSIPASVGSRGTSAPTTAAASTEATTSGKGNSNSRTNSKTTATTSAEKPKTPGAGSGTSMTFMHVTLPGEEIPTVVGGVTNLVLALGRADGLAGVLAARAWTNALEAVCNKTRTDAWRRGVLEGINQRADMSLLTSEFSPRLQVIQMLRSGELPHFSTGDEV